MLMEQPKHQIGWISELVCNLWHMRPIVNVHLL